MSDESEVDKAEHHVERSEDDEEAGISFNPPVYKQRYLAVHEIINKYSAKKVLDFLERLVICLYARCFIPSYSVTFGLSLFQCITSIIEETGLFNLSNPL